MARWGSVPSWVVRAAQLAVCVALLALLWRTADGPDALGRLAGAHPGWLAAAFAALTLQTVLSALRWRLTARPLGIVLGPAHAVREYYLAQIVNQSLPGGMIGDAGRAVRARRQAGLMAAGQAVIFERLAGQIAMFLALAVGFLGTSMVPGGLDWPSWLALPVGLFLLAGLVLPLAFAAACRLPGVVGRSAARVARLLGVALAGRGVLTGQILLSLGTTACILAAFAFCARAVGSELALAEVFGLVPLILFTMLIPLSISGWGLREGAAAALFPLAGEAASAGLATSIAFGLVFIAASLPGLMVLWQSPARHRGDAEDASEGPADDWTRRRGLP
jgi:uncharacterized membrane protein YbhN (UPF0104 family)